MKAIAFNLLALVGAVTSGCASYRPQPLTRQSVDQQLTVPTEQQLKVQAAAFRHPLLKPIVLDAAQGLTPDGAAVLAVLLNPAVRSARAQRQAAEAQLISAGILPNPQFSWTEDLPSGGADQGTVNAFGLGLTWDATSLLTQDAKVQSAKLGAQAVDLSIAWQEWQVAQSARTAVYDLIALRQQLMLAKKVNGDLAKNADLLRHAVEQHEKTMLELAAAEAASEDANTTVQSISRDVQHQELVLFRAIGLPPHANIKLAEVALPSRLSLPTEAELIEDLVNRRLDLVALRRGYDSQEETVRAAILAQFPRVSLGFTKSRDTTNVQTLGFGVTVDLPIFDRNQGVIATETATRQRLFNEYTQRIFETRNDIVAALEDVQAIQGQLVAQEQAIPSLQKLVDTYRANMNAGNVDVVSYYTVLGNLVAKQINVLKLKQQLMDNRIALEVATGRYVPDTTTGADQPKR